LWAFPSLFLSYVSRLASDYNKLGGAECVIENETGFIVPVNDPIAMSERIIEISCDEQKRKNFGENGLKRFKENFTSKKYAEKFESLYTEVANNKKFKTISAKENIMIESFLQVYQVLSDHHWKLMGK
jgi:hypothetical protein